MPNNVPSKVFSPFTFVYYEEPIQAKVAHVRADEAFTIRSSDPSKEGTCMLFMGGPAEEGKARIYRQTKDNVCLFEVLPYDHPIEILGHYITVPVTALVHDEIQRPY